MIWSKGNNHSRDWQLSTIFMEIIVSSGKMKQEMVKNHPLDMQPYGMILGTHREPCKPNDKLLHTDDSNHCIIMSNNHVSNLTFTAMN